MPALLAHHLQSSGPVRKMREPKWQSARERQQNGGPQDWQDPRRNVEDAELVLTRSFAAPSAGAIGAQIEPQVPAVGVGQAPPQRILEHLIAEPARQPDDDHAYLLNGSGCFMLFGTARV